MLDGLFRRSSFLKFAAEPLKYEIVCFRVVDLVAGSLHLC